KLKMKLKKLHKTFTNKKIDSQSLLSNQHQITFNSGIQNNYVQTLTNKNNVEYNIEQKWSFFRDTFKEAAVNTVGYMQRKKKQWLSENTWIKIQERKQAKLSLLSTKDTSVYEKVKQRYTLLDKEVKHSARKDKQDFIHNLACDAETAARTGNNKAVFHIMKQLCNHTPTANAPIKDKQGKLLLSEEQQKQRWAEHFREILNRPQPDTVPNIDEEEAMPPLD
ncbi:unnamed protein product, partial [Candidula unifasciata]